MQFPELEYPYPINFIQLKNNQSIAYRDLGDSDEVVLFVHGLASSLRAWELNIPFLKDYFRCIAIDLPGYGKSSAIVHSGTPDFYSNTIVQFLEDRKIRKVNLVGHSMGGQIAINTAINYPTLVEKLILVSPAGLETFSKYEISWIKQNVTIESFAETTDEQIRINYENNFYKMPAAIESVIQDRIKMKSMKNFMSYCKVVTNSLYGLVENPVFERISEIKHPTMILFGKEDKLIPHPLLHKNQTLDDIKKAALEKNPHLQFKMFDKCGHFLQYEKPYEFNCEIKPFLNTVDPKN